MRGRGDLWRALGAFCEAPGPAHDRLAAALGLPRGCTPSEHTDVFVLETHPYASVHLGHEGMLGGEVAERVAGFWRALGLAPPAEPDHLASLLGLLAALADAEAAEADPARSALRREARRALLWEHLLPWADPYLHAVRSLGVVPAAAWADLLRDALLTELNDLGALGELPIHLRGAQPGLAGPDTRLKDLCGSVLAPARSGIVVTRSDLLRGAGALGVGARLGERAFVLRSMLEQSPVATLGWLADQTERWATHHGSAHDLGAIAEIWKERATAAAAQLRAYSEAAQEVDADATAGER
jgi:hypothetical protein